MSQFILTCSQNEKFSYGYASSAGKRSSMEDFFETRIDGVNGEIVGLFGVFDGIFFFRPLGFCPPYDRAIWIIFYLQDMVEPQQLSIWSVIFSAILSLILTSLPTPSLL